MRSIPSPLGPVPCRAFVLIGAVMAALAAGCGGVKNAPAGPPDGAGAGGQVGAIVIEMSDFRFEPALVTVAPGTRIVFVNRATTPHNAVEGTASEVARADHEPRFSSPVLTHGERWELVLNEPGVYDYACTVASHYLLGMIGRIVVEEGA